MCTALLDLYSPVHEVELYSKPEMTTKQLKQYITQVGISYNLARLIAASKFANLSWFNKTKSDKKLLKCNVYCPFFFYWIRYYSLIFVIHFFIFQDSSPCVSRANCILLSVGNYKLTRNQHDNQPPAWPWFSQQFTVMSWSSNRFRCVDKTFTLFPMSLLKVLLVARFGFIWMLVHLT